MVWLLIAVIAAAALAFGLMGYMAGSSRIRDVEWGVNFTFVVMLVIAVLASTFSLFSPLVTVIPWMVGAAVGRIVRGTKS